MATDLTRIGEKARKDPQLVFTSLYPHITDGDNLRDCYETLTATKATGVDGVTKAEYGQHLEANLQDLSARLQRMGYRPGPKQRCYLPKTGSAKGRPLGLSKLEDKIVEKAVKRTLGPIYEAVFEDSSYGYRPGRSQHHCVHALGQTIQQKRVNQLVEAASTRFFDTVNWAWLLTCLRQRIGDARVIRLIIRMLKSGIMEEGLVHATEAGTPQGSILSPLRSTITLHYVLDLWFSQQVRRQGQTIQQKRVNQLVEADSTRFFDTVNWAWLLTCLRQRIGDARVIRLIIRMLKSGIMEEGLVHATEAGTPQGSILSPLRSTITLHYVLDLWFSQQVRRQCRGEA